MPRINTKRGVIITRVSRETQVGEGHHSLSDQRKDAVAFAKREGIDVPEDMIFELPGESAYRGNRKKFNQAIDKAFELAEKSNEPVGLIVYEEDRLTRRVVTDTMYKIERLIQDGKFALKFFKDGKTIDKYSPANDWLTFRMRVTIAEDESRKKADRSKDMIRHKLERNEYPNYCGTGYLQPKGEHKIVIDHERSHLITKAFKLFDEKDYTVQELTSIMRDAGLTTKAKNGGEPKLITVSSLLWILHNPFYVGKFRWKNPETGVRELHQGTHPALIDEETFNRVQKKISERAIKFSTRHSTAKFYKFRGLLKCAFCGCTLTPTDMSSNYKNKKPGEEVYYRCTYSKKYVDPDWYQKRFGTKNCPQEFWKEEEIEQEIKNHLGLLHYDAKVFQRLRDGLNRQFKEQIELSQLQKHKLELDLSQKEKLKEALIDKMALEDYVDFKLDMRERLNKVKTEIDKIKADIEQFDSMEKLQTDQFVDKLILCSNLKEQYQKLTPMKQREVVLLAFESVTAGRGETNGVKKDGLNFEWNEPFQTLLATGIDKLLPEMDKLHKAKNHWPTDLNLINTNDPL